MMNDICYMYTEVDQLRARCASMIKTNDGDDEALKTAIKTPTASSPAPDRVRLCTVRAVFSNYYLVLKCI